VNRTFATLLLSLLLTGCVRKSQEPTPDPGALFGQIEQLLGQSRTEEALALAGQALADPRWTQHRPYIFQRYLSLLVSAGRGAEAADLYRERLDNPDLARSGYAPVFDFFAQSDATNAVETWTRELLDRPLPPDLQEHNLLRLADALARRGAFAGITDLLPLCLARFDPPAVRRIADRWLRQLLDAQQYAEAERLLDALAAQAGEQPALAGLLTLARIHLFLRQAQWPQAEELFARHLQKLSDEDAQRAVTLIASEARAREQWELADRVCLLALEQRSAASLAGRQAAGQWLATAEARREAAEIPRRLSALLDRALPPEQVCSLYRRHFYTALAPQETNAVAAMVALAERLDPLLKDAGDREALQPLLFDAAFLAGDYQRSLDMLLSGALARDPDWTRMAENKLRAHLALQQGRTDEAVQRFRDFMDYVERSWEQPERDPMTGLEYTKDMTLGLNARRIGDILAQAGQRAAADASYAQARARFQQALAAAKADSPEAAWLNQQLATLPKAEAAP